MDIQNNNNNNNNNNQNEIEFAVEKKIKLQNGQMGVSTDGKIGAKNTTSTHLKE